MQTLIVMAGEDNPQNLLRVNAVMIHRLFETTRDANISVRITTNRTSIQRANDIDAAETID